jgi:hypothetical protein
MVLDHQSAADLRGQTDPELFPDRLSRENPTWVSYLKEAL